MRQLYDQREVVASMKMVAEVLTALAPLEHKFDWKVAVFEYTERGEVTHTTVASMRISLLDVDLDDHSEQAAKKLWADLSFLREAYGYRVKLSDVVGAVNVSRDMPRALLLTE